MSTTALILASGLDARMNSSLPPCLHAVLGDASLLWVLRALPPSVTSAVILCPEASEVASAATSAVASAMTAAVEAWRKKELLGCPVTLCPDPAQAIAELDRAKASAVLVLSGETPLVDPAALDHLAAHPAPAHSEAARLLSWTALRPLLAAADPAADPAANRAADPTVHPGDIQASIQAATSGAPRVEPRSPHESRRLASRRDQATLQALARDEVNGRWMDEGVSILDPSSTWIGPRAVLAPDVTLDPGVRLEGRVIVGRGSRIGQGSLLQDCTLGEGVEIKAYTVAQEAVIGRSAIVGPFARLREGSLLEERVHVGNFVETKKSTLRAGAKANHLSYVGDTEVGEGTNLGAGLITCNYDGFKKHRTIIGRNVFVGSDCQLVAPVTIGDGALLGAGSTITEDIPAGALAITRAPLVVKEGGAERLRDRLRAQLG